MKKLVLLLAVLVLSASLFAQGQGKGKGKGRSREDSGQATVAMFGDSDRRIIDEWVRDVPPSGLPPGLAKRGDLPPGLQKQLHKNGTLPPGLQKKISPFPVELTRRLTPLPAGCGCERVFLDGKAMIVVRATYAILDLIRLF